VRRSGACEASAHFTDWIIKVPGLFVDMQLKNKPGTGFDKIGPTPVVFSD
jgi:hypothetical protein